MANKNCLEDMKCPNCGSEEPFVISSECEATVFDDGVEETTDHFWSDESHCRCLNCSHRGTVYDFMVK